MRNTDVGNLILKINQNFATYGALQSVQYIMTKYPNSSFTYHHILRMCLHENEGYYILDSVLLQSKLRSSNFWYTKLGIRMHVYGQSTYEYYYCASTLPDNVYKITYTSLAFSIPIGPREKPHSHSGRFGESYT